MELNLVGSLRFEFGACQRCQPRPDIPQEMAEDRVQLTVATLRRYFGEGRWRRSVGGVECVGGKSRKFFEEIRSRKVSNSWVVEITAKLIYPNNM